MASIIPNLTKDRMSGVPAADYQHRVIGWAKDAITESEAFLRAQPQYDRIAPTIMAINGEFDQPFGRVLSSTNLNRFGKIALNLVAGLTDTKPFWDYRTLNPRFKETAEILGKLSQHWWQGRMIDLRFADAIKYACAAGTGWCHHVGWNKETQDLDVLSEDPRDVLPIRPSTFYSIQDALGVIIRRERTVNYVRDLYPESAHLIKADRDGSHQAQVGATRSNRLLSSLNAQLSPFHANLLAQRSAHRIQKIPTVDMFTLYVKDNSVNDLTVPVRMGEEDKNWSYIVDPRQPLYPRRRMVVFTRTAILYDGPNPFWHGLFPLNKLTLDPWPWTWLGKAPLWDILPLQKSLNSTMRIIDDHNQRVAEPGVMGDKNALSRRGMRKINTRRPGLKFSYNPISGKPAQILYEPPLDPSIGQHVAFLIEQMDDISGVRDLSNLMKLNQLPAADTIEKITETMTPANRLRSRYMEAFIREFAVMTASNFFQFYTTPMRLAILGPNAIVAEDFDFDPGSLVPDYVADTDFGDAGTVTQMALNRGPLARVDRATHFLRYFTFHIAPASLLASSEIERKLLYLSLARAGLIDHWTLLETLGVDNVGEPPQGARTITERLQAEQQEGLGMNISPTGRKASGQTMPRMVTKES
jgi:hypothetical protein